MSKIAQKFYIETVKHWYFVKNVVVVLVIPQNKLINKFPNVKDSQDILSVLFFIIDEYY